MNPAKISTRTVISTSWILRINLQPISHAFMLNSRYPMVPTSTLHQLPLCNLMYFLCEAITLNIHFVFLILHIVSKNMTFTSNNKLLASFDLELTLYDKLLTRIS